MTIRATDANQAEIMQALRQIGATVQDLSQVGRGCPDLLVGYRGRNHLLEVKRDRRARLTRHEQDWHDGWRGQVCVVRSAYEAVEAIAKGEN